ncbi:MAG: thioredoxin-like domain-containing protein [Bacteroidota bacterium]
MKKASLIAVLLLLGMAPTFAGQGYKLHLSMPGVKDSMVFLAHYYGKNRPTIFKTDSAYFDKNGKAEMKSNDPEFTGGIYILYLSDMSTNFEVLMNAGDDITIIAPINKLPDGIVYRNSPENERFAEYIKFLKNHSASEEKLKKEIEAARTKSDTEVVRRKAKASSKVLNDYRRDYVKRYPGTLLARVFDAIEVPEVPEGDHYLADGKTKDTTYAYRYYKKHFWDGYNFQDDRLIYTPIYDAKLEEYFTKLVLPWTDSIEKEADILLKKTKGTKDQFHYTLWWLTRHVEESKVMGMDEVFVYLAENYYMKGDAFWLKSDELAKFIDRARKIAPNVIGNVAPPLKLPNIKTKKEEDMHAVKAKYTLVVFYSPNCGHCQHEMPSLDSLYEKVLKDKGVKVYTVSTEGEEKAINEFITKYKIDDWINTWDHDHTSDYHNKYDVYSTPTIYLLDNRKIIKGKRLDHKNVGNLIEMLEKKEKEKATGKS